MSEIDSKTMNVIQAPDAEDDKMMRMMCASAQFGMQDTYGDAGKRVCGVAMKGTHCCSVAQWENVAVVLNTLSWHMARKVRMADALNKIIEMNRQHAQDQYGDPEKAESWSCVKVAREALNI